VVEIVRQRAGPDGAGGRTVLGDAGPAITGWETP
jgi:hypothetical protein